MNIVLFGYGEMACAALEFLGQQGERVTGVITHLDDPAEKRWFRSVSDIARAANIPVVQEDAPSASKLDEEVRRFRPDLILSFYYRKLIPMRILCTAPRGAFNLHGSLLPRLRGRAPLNWALVDGEDRTGVTLHHMTAAPDAGDIVAQRAFDIGPKDIARTLFDKAVAETKILMRDLWPSLREGKAARIPQDPAKATYRGRRGPEDGRIDWTLPTKRVDGLVRAVADPFPGAFTTLDGRKLMVWQGSPAGGRGRPGEVLEDAVVATGDGAYRLERFEWAGDGAGPPRLPVGNCLGV